MNATWRVSKKGIDEIRWDDNTAWVRERRLTAKQIREVERSPLLMRGVLLGKGCVNKNVARKENRNESRGPDNRALRKALLWATLLWLQSLVCNQSLQ